jgi:peptidoglycan hydrolase-like protein with peptidoglycan-binding domain/TPR repeat protein
VSRSHWAWTKSCALFGAALAVARRLGTDGLQARLRHERVTHTSSSLPLLTWAATATMLMLALTPATALGQVGSPHHRDAVASATRDASRAHAATRNPVHQSARGASSAGRRSQSEVLAFGAGYGSVNGSPAVRALQRRLISLGYSPGPVDGRYGPLTERGVIGFQAAHGLQADGIAGPLTLGALSTAKPVLYPGEGSGRGGSQAVRNLQRALTAAGFASGPIDGRYGPRTERAVKRYQAAHHLQVDGIAGPQTLGRLQALAPRIHHQIHPASHETHPKSPQPRATHRHTVPARPHSSPSRRPKPVQSRQVTKPAGALPILWIVVLACLLAALLAAALWHTRGRRSGGVAAPERRPSRRRKVSPFGRTVTAREDASHLALTPVDLRERAGERLSDDRAEEQPGAAAFRLGLLLVQDGNLVEAEDAFRRADERGHSDAAFELGLLLMQEGDRNAAREAFRRADGRGHASAAFDLGILLAQEGDRGAAKDAFRRAEERGHPDAAFDLGALLLQERDLAGAEDAFRRGDRRGDPGAACNLGVLLEQRGDPEGAKAAYRRADEQGHPVAACNLGALLEHEGDLAAAKEAYGRADRRADPIGSYNLGRLLEQEGDRDGAKEAFRRADQRGNPEAACSLGFLLKQEGDRAGAFQAFKRAGEQGSQEVAEVAHAELLELTGAEESDR